MARITKVNYHNLHITADKFTENTDKLREIVDNLTKLDERLSSCWHGYDADTYINRNEILINNLTRKREYLDGWSSYLGKCSNRYSDTVNENTTSVKNANNNILEEDPNVTNQF